MPPRAHCAGGVQVERSNRPGRCGGARPLLILLVALIAAPAAAQDDGAPPRGMAGRDQGDGRGSLALRTPQATMETFLDAARDGRFGLAARALDLRFEPLADLPGYAEELARRLFQVLDRHAWIDWSALPDRPDGLIANASADDPLAGKERRSLVVAVLDRDGRDAELRLHRVERASGGPAWLFSPRTVRQIPALSIAYGPGMLERALPEWAGRRGVLGLRQWEWIALPACLAAAALVFLVVRLVLTRIIGRLPGDGWPRRLGAAIRLPVALLAASLTLALATRGVITFSAPVTTFLSPMLVAAVATLVVWIGFGALGEASRWVTEHYVGSIEDEEHDESRHLYTNISLARRILLLVAIFAVAGIVCLETRLFQSFGVTLLGAAGVLTIVVGIAAQTVLGNVLASIQVALAKPVRIGDIVLFDGTWGRVEEINYTFILIRVWNQRRLVVPIKHFVSEPFENWSTRDPHLVLPVELRVDLTTDVDALRRRFQEMLEGEEDWDRRQDPTVQVVDSDADGMTVRFYVSAANSTLAWNLHCRIRERMIRILAEADGGAGLPRERHVLLREPATAAGG